MTLDLTQITVAMVGLMSLVSGGALSYRASRDKLQFDSYAALQAEIGRLREDLRDRDAHAEADHEQILKLRHTIQRQTLVIAERDAHLRELTVEVERMRVEMAELRVMISDLSG